MLSSKVSSLLVNDPNAQPKHKVWFEYFQKSESVSKEFLKLFPQFKEYTDFLKFKGYDFIAFKKAISGATSPQDFDNKLALLYHLKDKVPIEILDICNLSVIIEDMKKYKKMLQPIFSCVFRNFIAYAYQLPNLIRNNVEQISYITIFINFFIRFKESKKFSSVIIIFNSIFQDLESIWSSIFSTTNASTQQIACFQFLCFLPPLTEVMLKNFNNHVSFDFIVVRLCEAIRILSCDYFSITLMQSLLTVLSSFLALIQIDKLLNTEDLINLCIVTSEILFKVVKYNKLTPTDQYKLGSRCLAIYSKASTPITDELAKKHFQIMIHYALWIVSTFPDNHQINSDESSDISNNPIDSLGPIGLKLYLSKSETIPLNQPLVENNYLQQSGKQIAEACHSSKRELLLISLFVSSLKESETQLNSDQYKSYAGFILYVISHFNEQSLSDGLSGNWMILFSPNLFPLELKYTIDKNLRESILYMLINCFRKIKTSRVVIFNTITEYLKKLNDSKGIYLFLPLFNSIFIVDDEKTFAGDLIKSSLMDYLLKDSLTNLSIFDFIRNIAYAYPTYCFESRALTKFCFDHINNSIYMESISACIENALINCSNNPKYSHILSSLVCTITTLIDENLSLSNSNHEMALHLITILTNSFNKFGSEDAQLLLLASTFEVLARSIQAFDNENIFNLIFQKYIEMCKQNSTILQYFTSSECKVYSILQIYCENKNVDTIFDVRKPLFEFLLLDSLQINRNTKIKNFRVIPLIFTWAKKATNELQYYNDLLDIASAYSSNIYEFVRANTALLAINRIKEIGINEKTMPLFRLYCLCCNVSFPAPVFYETLNLMIQPNFDYPLEFLKFFVGLIQNPKPYENINSFFQFEEGSIIKGPNSFNLGCHFAVSTFIRTNNLTSKDKNELFSFSFCSSSTNTSNDAIIFSLNESFIEYERYGKSPLKDRFSTKIDGFHQWISIFIDINLIQDRVTLFVNGKRDSNEITNDFSNLLNLNLPKDNSNLHSQSVLFDIEIGKSFIGDISDIFICNDCFIPPYNSENPLCHFSPKAVIDNKIFTVFNKQNIKNDIITFNGKTVLFACPFTDNLKNEASFVKILPIFKRLQGCAQCCKDTNSGDNLIQPPERCKICGSLNANDGNDLLTSLLYIFKAIISSSELLIAERKYMIILSDYIIKMNRYYLNEKLFENLLRIFKSLKTNEAINEMIEAFWLNVDFFEPLSNEIKLKYFNIVIQQAYGSCPKAFDLYEKINNLFYLALSHYSQDNEVSHSFWKFIIKIISNRTQFSSFSFLLTVPMFHEYIFSAISSFECINSLISSENSLFFSILENSDYYVPFTFLMHIPNVRIQSLALHTINKIYRKGKNQEIASAFYQLVACFVPDKNDDKSILKIIEDMLFGSSESNQCCFDIIEAFPFLTVISTFANPELAKLIYDKFINTLRVDQNESLKLTKIPNWQFWMIRYTKQFYAPEDMLFKLPFTLIISSIICQNEAKFDESIHKLFLILSQEYNKSVSNYIINDILKEVFKDKSVIPQVGSYFLSTLFICLFYRITMSDLKPEETYQYSEIFPNSDRFLWLSSLHSFKVYFSIDCLNENENDLETSFKWNDIEIAENLMNFLDLFYKNEISIFNFTTTGLILYTYIASYLLRFGSEKAGYYLEKILVLMKNVDEEIRHICASIIIRVNSQIEENYRIDIEPFTNLDTDFTDDEDSSAYQLFLLEMQFTNQCSTIENALHQHELNIVNDIDALATKTLKIDKDLYNKYEIQESQNDEINLKIDRFYSSISSLSFINLKTIFNDLSQSQYDLIQNEHSYRLQIVKSFENELNALISDNKEMHFKSINRISQKGKRTLLAINYNFNDHKIASLSRDTGEKNIFETDNSDFNIKINRISLHKSSETEIFHSSVQMITPHRTYTGDLFVTKKSIIFDGSSRARVKHIEINNSSILFAMTHMIGREDDATEIFTDINRSYLFNFKKGYRRNFFVTIEKVTSERFAEEDKYEQEVKNKTSKLDGDEKYNLFVRLRKVYGHVYQDKKKSISQIMDKIELVKKWQNRKITNYEFLFYLNILSGRSFNDLSKYPVFPLILLFSDKLDFTDRSLFRDLSKPIGALGKKRLENLIKNYNEIDEPNEKCLYRTHFSSPILVCGFLIRIEPFTTLHIAFQDKKFDKANRLFSTYQFNLEESSDFRELIPEFFSFPEFLVNSNKFDFGKNINDVTLPGWAKSPDHFIRMNSRALESEIVSETLNKWVDLMFGINRNSFDALNVFHPNVYLETKPSSPEESRLLEDHVLNIGCYPLQIFQSPCPQRGPLLSSNDFSKKRFETNETAIRFRKQVIVLDNMKIFNTMSEQCFVVEGMSFGDIIEVSKLYNLVIFAKKNDATLSMYDMISAKLKILTLASTMIHCGSVIGGRYVALGVSDCSIKLFKLPSLSSFKTSSYHSSSIVAIAGSCEVGLMVSIDAENKLIFENLYESGFIRSLTLSKSDDTPFLCVFKSGKVIVILRNENNTIIKFYSVNGNLLDEIIFEEPSVEYDKYYEPDTRELLVVSFLPGTIRIIDITTFEVVGTFKGSFGNLKFCTIKRKRSILFGTGHSAQIMPFTLQK